MRVTLLNKGTDAPNPRYAVYDVSGNERYLWGERGRRQDAFTTLSEARTARDRYQRDEEKRQASLREENGYEDETDVSFVVVRLDFEGVPGVEGRWVYGAVV